MQPQALAILLILMCCELNKLSLSITINYIYTTKPYKPMKYEVKKSNVKRMRVRIATVYAVTMNFHEIKLLLKSYLLALSDEAVHVALGLSNSQLIKTFESLQHVFVSFPFFVTPEESLKLSVDVDLTNEQLLDIKNTLEARLTHCEQQRDQGHVDFNETSWLDMRMLRCDLSEMYTTAIQPVDELSMTDDVSEEPVAVEDN
jgi:hypothetical protein